MSCYLYNIAIKRVCTPLHFFLIICNNLSVPRFDKGSTNCYGSQKIALDLWTRSPQQNVITQYSGTNKFSGSIHTHCFEISNRLRNVDVSFSTLLRHSTKIVRLRIDVGRRFKNFDVERSTFFNFLTSNRRRNCLLIFVLIVDDEIEPYSTSCIIRCRIHRDFFGKHLLQKSELIETIFNVISRTFRDQINR